MRAIYQGENERVMKNNRLFFILAASKREHEIKNIIFWLRLS